MCTTSGQSCGTVEGIYKKINDTLQESNIPWRNCVGLSIDNAPVNTGAKNSIAARMLRENGSIYIHGACHIVHNTAKHAGQKFLEVSSNMYTLYYKSVKPNAKYNSLLYSVAINL